MAGLLPTDFYNGNLITSGALKNPSKNPPMLQDYLIDLETGHLIISESGQFTIVEGLEAVITQSWRKLHTEQGLYNIFSSKYGNTFTDLIGKGKSYADAYINLKLKSTLVDDVYIKSVDNIKVALSKDIYTITFTINTIYGDTSQKLDIPIDY